MIKFLPLWMIVLALSAAALLATAVASSAQPGDYSTEPQPLRGSYYAYSRDPGDAGAPGRGGDAKISFEITGQAAAEMFGYMGPAARVSMQEMCGEENKTEEFRKRGDLECVRTLATRQTVCYFSMDMRNGKSRYARVC